MSGPRNPNSRAMRALAEELARAGVTDACVSPGSRSTAAVLALARTPGMRPWVVTDERSAGFFALGMARETGRPVVLLCTSGTAAANYLPAVVEASLSRVPLVVLTADRPPELRDCHAAQTIDQVRIFGSHVRWSVDAAAPADGLDLEDYYRTLACRAVAASTEAPRGPVHLNLPMREPLLDVAEEVLETAAPTGRPADGEARGERPAAAAGRISPATGPDGDAVSAARDSDHSPRESRPFTLVHQAPALPRAQAVRALVDALRAHERGVIVAGPGAAGEDGAEAVVRLAHRCGWPILADPLSGLRFGVHDRGRVVDAYDVVLRDPGLCGALRPDAVLQLGAPVVSAALQRFLAEGRARPHLVVAPPGTWPDPLYRATEIVRADAAALCAAAADRLPGAPARSRWLATWLAVAGAARAALDHLLADEDACLEGAVLARLCAALPRGAALHVGNSLPVRALDTFVGASPAVLAVACNRGANGIDGVLSAALGAAAARREPTALVLGDLSFLHDLGALQIAARHRIPLLVVVVHNDGGGIFSFLPQAALGAAFETYFATPHGLALGDPVAMCGGRHGVLGSPAEIAGAVERWLGEPGLVVLELRGDRARARDAHARLVALALAAAREACPGEARR